MPSHSWPTKPFRISELHLDQKNPRLGRQSIDRAPREIIQYLFDHDKAVEVAESISERGYFPNEPLLAVREEGRLVVVEGNRRLAALKALHEPKLIEGALQRKVERLGRRAADKKLSVFIPVTIAPNRRATDKLIVGRHIGTPVLAWQAENRASFILEKLAEGYGNEDLQEDLGFTDADIQQARQTRAIADMARSLDLPDEIKAKLDAPRAKLFTTLERVFDSSVGRSYLRVEPDVEHGIRGRTSRAAFLRAFSRLVKDVALGKQSSRTLNSNDNIKAYFESWDKKDLPVESRTTFTPADVIKGKSVASRPQAKPQPQRKQKAICATVLPKDLKVRYGTERIVDIRHELTRVRRKDYPNAGAVLLRVFFELSAIAFLKRIGEYPRIVARLGGNQALTFGAPTMKQLAPELIRLAKKNLAAAEANKVEKAIRYDAAAPFTVSDLHAFIHQDNDPPGDRDIWQFWLRMEPMFRLMLEQENVVT